MKTMFKGAAVAAAILATSPVLAQTGPVLIVDVNRLFAESAAAKSAVSQMQTKYQPLANSQQAAFNTAATAYNTQVEAARKLVKPDGSGLPEAQRTALAASEQALRAADETLNRTQQEANAVNGYVREQILRAVVPIAEQIRVERRAVAVVPRGQVLAADPAADVTTVLMQRLDGSLKTVSIQLPQQAQPARPAAGQPAPNRPAPQGR